MSKGVIYLTCMCILFGGLCTFAAESSGSDVNKTKTEKVINRIFNKQGQTNNSAYDKNQDVDPTAVSTRVKDFFNKNEQKEKKIRSKDIVKYKEKIRKQEMLRLQKEKEIKYLERRLEEKQKTLERLEKSKGE